MGFTAKRTWVDYLRLVIGNASMIVLVLLVILVILKFSQPLYLLRRAP